MRSSRRRNTEPQIKQKVIRCKLNQTIKFEHESCGQFNGRQNQSGEQRNCLHCQHSFWRSWWVMKGIVNWYNEAQGKGLICGSDGTDLFVYRSSLDFLTLLHAGDEVEYDVRKTGSALQAINLKTIMKKPFWQLPFFSCLITKLLQRPLLRIVMTAQTNKSYLGNILCCRYLTRKPRNIVI